MNILYHHRTRALQVEGVHIRGIVDGLRRLGHRVDVVSPPGVTLESQATTAGAPAKTRWSLLSTHAPELLFESAEIAYNGYAYPMLAARLGLKDYQFIYERYALFSVAGVLAARRYHLPIVLEVNDSAVVSRIRPLKWQAAARRAEKFIWQRASAVITISDHFRDLIVDAGVKRARVHVMPNAVDEQRFATLPDSAELRQRLGLGDKTVIGYLGALNHWRRLDLLLEAFAKVATEHPQATVLLVGEGPDREALQAQAQALGFSHRVQFVGKVDHGAIVDYLMLLDIAVIPHSNDYGSPMKLGEYMAAGKAVVAPSLPPIAQVVGAGEGILFAPLDVDELAHALERLLCNEPLRQQIGARAREKVMTQYVWRHHVEATLQLVDDIGKREEGLP